MGYENEVRYQVTENMGIVSYIVSCSISLCFFASSSLYSLSCSCAYKMQNAGKLLCIIFITCPQVRLWRVRHH